MIYDCIMFFNELELLELRFNVMYEAVDKFVIVESTRNHAGEPKPLIFEQNKQRYQKWLDKVIHVVVDDFPVEDAWGRENHQRRGLYRALAEANAKDDDIIIVADCDEIIKPEIIKGYRPDRGISCIEMRMSYYFMNCRGVDGQKMWSHAKIGPYSLIKKLDVCRLRYTLPNMRYNVDGIDFYLDIIPDAGWHFSFLGGIDAIATKIKAYCHQELNKEEYVDKEHIYRAVSEGKDLFNRGFNYKLGEVDETYPQYVRDNLQHFIDIGFVSPVQKETKRKVFDCFTFFNELDILEIRLNELYPYVDKFIIAEMPVTHTNLPKPLYFDDNKERFEKFLPKIEHVIVNEYPLGPDPWNREHHQRDVIRATLDRLAQDDDIVIVSDVDEIPRGSRIEEFDAMSSPPLMYFEQRFYKSYLDADAGVQKADRGVFSRITTFGHIKEKGLSITGVRYEPVDDSMKIVVGGWHFSWISGGSGDNVLNKLLSYAHQEVIDRWIVSGKIRPDIREVPATGQDSVEIQKAINSGEDAIGHDTLKIVPIDSTFPKFVIENEAQLRAKRLISPKETEVREYKGYSGIKKSDTPDVAIVMPYYNDPELLVKSVERIIFQDYTKWKLFIIDDGSDPDKAATQRIKQNSKVSVIRKPNGGPSSARNVALSMIKKNLDFKYIAFCDADDRWEKGYLSSQVASLKDADLVYSEVKKEFVDGSEAVAYGIPDPVEYPGLEFLKQQGFIFISSVVCKRDCLNVGDFDTSLDSIEDWDMWVRIAKAGHRIKKNPNAEITYVVKPSGNMAAHRTDEKYEQFVKKHNKVERPEVTAYISTKDRYFTTLPLAIQAIVHQTYPVKNLIIFDDGEHKDLRELAPYRELFQLLSMKGIQWYWMFAERKGQVANHNKAIEFEHSTEWLWRVDDDDCPEPNCLEKLIRNISPEVGAIGGLVYTPSQPIVSLALCSGDIRDIYGRLNLQWSVFTGVKEVDHLHNTFIYRRSASKHGYPRNLSPVGHREETIFSYEMKRNGWKLLIDPEAKTWHLRDPNGGIRSHKAEENYSNDEMVFQQKLKDWGVKLNDYKLFILNSGLGDHYCFKMILPEIRKKYQGIKLLISNCYPEVFADEPDLHMLSIADGIMLEKEENHNVYKWAWDHNWKESLVGAYRGLYL